MRTRAYRWCFLDSRSQPGDFTSFGGAERCRHPSRGGTDRHRDGAASLLSGRRTALIFPSRKAESVELFGKPGNRADAIARLQAGVMGSVRACDGKWCRFSGEGFDGYVQQQNLWGVYPEEKLD
jgi:hypothetical protein